MKAIYCFKRLDTVLESPNLIFCQCLNVSTTPLCQWGFRPQLDNSKTTTYNERPSREKTAVTQASLFKKGCSSYVMALRGK